MILSSVLVSEVCKNLQIDNTTLNITRFKIYEHLNQAQRHLLLTLPPEKLREAIYEGYSNLVAATPDYNLPSDCIRLIGVYVDYENSISGTNRGRELTLVHGMKFAQDNIDRQSISLYPYGTIINSTQALSGYSGLSGGYYGRIHLSKSPDSGVASGIKFVYISNLIDLKGDDPTTSGTDEAVPTLLGSDKYNLIIYYATALSATVNTYSLELYKTFMELFNFELQKYVTN